MKRVALAMLLLTSVGCAKKVPLSATLGAPLDFTASSYPGGKPFQLSTERGQVVMVEVWASWCVPCREVLPLYQQFADTYAEGGFKVFALSVDEDPAQIDEFLKETGLRLPVLWDRQASVAEDILHVRLMPTTFLIDRKGLIRHIYEGLASSEIPMLRADIIKLIKEPKP